MLEQGIAPVLGRFDHPAVLVPSEGQAIRPANAVTEERIDRVRHLARVTTRSFAQPRLLIRGGLVDPGDRALPAMEDSHVFCYRDLVRGTVERPQVSVVGTSVSVPELVPGQFEISPDLDDREHLALEPQYPIPRP